MKPVTLLEVEEEMNQMAKGKAPGLDRFTINLFHHFWDLIKIEVWHIMENSRLSMKILHAFNATCITLLPKDNGPESLGKFQPIALCNVIYKIVTKVISNRLKIILPSLIPPKQSRFVEGR